MRPKAEAHEARDAGPTKSPTSLDLFRFSEAGLGQVRAERDAVLQFRRDFTTITATYDRFTHAAGQRVDSIVEASKAFEQRRQSLRSPIVVSKAYLMIEEELRLQGSSPEEIMHLFTSAVAINTRLTPQFVTLAFRYRRSPGKLAETLEGHNAKKMGIDGLFRQIKPHAWHERNERHWKAYISGLVFFPILFGDASIQVRKDALPDWLRASNQPPPLPLVQKELKDDAQAGLRYVAYEKAIREHDEAIQKRNQAVSVQAIAAIEEQKREAIPTRESLSDVVLFLEMVRNVWEYKPSPDEIRSLPASKMSTIRISPQELRAKTIREFVATFDKNLSSEAVALFFDQQLIEGGLIKSARDPVDADYVGFFTFLLDAMDSNIPQGEQFFRLLEQTHSMAFHTLKRIRPLLEIWPEDERRKLRELIEEWKGNELETIIWEVARLTAQYVQNKNPDGKAKATKEAIEAVKVLTAQWLNRYSRPLYQGLTKQIGNIESVRKDSLIQAQISTLEQAINQLEEGSLSGWKIYYVANEESKDRIKIEGRTLQERKEALATFFEENHIEANAESILQELEWTTTLSQDVESIEEPEEITFAKSKLGDVGLLHCIDPLKKELIFMVQET